MKICLIAFQAYPLVDPEITSSFGGTEVQLITLAKFFFARGFEVDVIVRDHGQDDEIDFGGIRILKSVSADGGKSLADALYYFKALRRSGADLYVSSTASPYVGLTALFCRAFSKRFIYRTAHQIDCSGQFERDNGWRGRLYGLGLRIADAVVTQNREHQTLLGSRGISSRVIRNVFELTSAPPLTQERAIDCLWVARSEHWKNPHLFLDLAAALPERSFTIICQRKPELGDFFDEVKARACSMANVDFLEDVVFKDVQPYFEASKVFVGTSEYEGFPNTYIQACMARTPLVSYKVNPDSFITANALGYSAEGDAEALVSVTRYLLDQPADWKVKSANARTYVEKCHDVRREGEQWLVVMEAVVQGVTAVEDGHRSKERLQ